MRYFIILLFLIFQNGFGQMTNPNKFFIKKGDQLVYYDGENLNPITTGNIQLCFPYILKGTDLYQITLKPVLSYQLVARGVTKVFNNNYLIRDKLFTIVAGKGVYVTDGVTDVYNSCPDPYNPRTYRGANNESPF